MGHANGPKFESCERPFPRRRGRPFHVHKAAPDCLPAASSIRSMALMGTRSSRPTLMVGISPHAAAACWADVRVPAIGRIELVTVGISLTRFLSRVGCVAGCARFTPVCRRSARGRSRSTALIHLQIRAPVAPRQSSARNGCRRPLTLLTPSASAVAVPSGSGVP
jgi:hypothetical protein